MFYLYECRANRLSFNKTKLLYFFAYCLYMTLPSANNLSKPHETKNILANLKIQDRISNLENKCSALHRVHNRNSAMSRVMVTTSSVRKNNNNLFYLLWIGVKCDHYIFLWELCKEPKRLMLQNNKPVFTVH